MSEADIAISVRGVSRVFRRYRRPGYRVLEAFGFRLPAGTYDEFWALRDVSVELRRGDSLGLIGQNGAGKSTLLNIICGRLQPSTGHVSVHGTVQALMELGTGFHPEFSGRDNIISALAYQGVTGRAARERLDEIVEFSELADFIEQPVKTYSSGMYARLAFSTATAITPDVLIIDEILGAGDAYFAAKCAERMHSLTKRTGATLLFVSHDIGAVQRLCERAIWIDHGRVRMIGPTLDISKEYYADVLAREEARLRAQTTATIERMRRRDNDRNGEGATAADVVPPPAVPAPATPLPVEQVAAAVAKVTEPALRDKWETAEARFVEVTVGYPGDDVSRHVFAFGEDIAFHITAELRVPIPLCWLALILLDKRGNRVCLAVHEFKFGFEAGIHRLQIALKQLRLRQGEYVASVELLPHFDYNWQDDVRLPYLCHWDRCVHFKIDEEYHGSIELGLVAVSIEVTQKSVMLTEVQKEAEALGNQFIGSAI